MAPRRPVSGIPVIGLGAGDIPSLGAGATGGQLPVIGLPASRTPPRFSQPALGRLSRRPEDPALKAITSGTPLLSRQALGGANRFHSLLSFGHDEEAKSEYAQMLMARGMDPAAAWASADIAVAHEKLKIQKANSALDVVSQAINIPGNIVANIFKGATDYNKTHDDGFWSAFTATYAGIEHAATTSPITKYGIEDYLAERAQDQGMGWLKNRVVQLSLSIALDPITYVTAGATAPAKIAAARALALGRRQSFTEAVALVEGRGSLKQLKSMGLQRVTVARGDHVLHEIHMADGTPVELNDLVNLIHTTQNRARSLSDALIDARKIGLARKSSELLHPVSEYRARRAGEKIIDPFTRKTVEQGPVRAAAGTAFRVGTGLVLPTNVKYGAGLRFGGLTVPGTVGFGEKVAKASRGGLEKRAIAETNPEAVKDLGMFGTVGSHRVGVVHGVMGAFVPRWRSSVIADDFDRALANLTLQEQRYRISALHQDVMEKAGNMASIVVNGEHLPAEERVGLFNKPSLSQPAQVLKMNIAAEVKRVKALGEHAGLKSNSFDSLWEHMLEKHADPIQALVEFKFRAESKVMRETFIHEIIEDPIFSRRFHEVVPEGGPAPMSVYGEVPTGYIKFHWKNKTYVVKQSIRDALDELASTPNEDKGIDAFLKVLGAPQKFWRVYATTPNPSFHVMNLLGAQWNNLYAGVYNPMDYIQAMGVLYNARLEQFAREGRRTLQPRIPGFSSPAATARAHDIFKSAAARGGLGRQSIFEELVMGKTYAKLPGEIGTRDRLREVVTKHPGESSPRYAFRQARRGAGVAALATGNPVMAAVAFAPEASAVGRKIGTTVEDVVRLAPYMKAARDPDAIKLIESYGPIRVPGLNHPGFTKAQQAAMYDIGAKLSTHFQFDYADLTAFEKRWAKTFFPFWVFYKNNFIRQIQTTVNRPRFINSALALQNYIAQNGTDIGAMADMLPTYFDTLDAFQVPVPEGIRKKLGLPLDEALYLNPKLPFVSVNLFPPLWEVAKNNGMTNSQRFGVILSSVMGSVGPWAPFPLPGGKIIMEAWVNTQLGLNQKIDYQRGASNDLQQSFVDAPGWFKYVPEPIRNALGAFPAFSFVNPFSSKNVIEHDGKFQMTATARYVLDQIATPFITNIGRSAVAVEPGLTGAKGTADLVSWVTGARLMPVDSLKIHRQWAYQMRDMLQAERSRLKKVGKDLSPEELYTYHQLTSAIKVLETAYKTRETELYGR